jgi:small ligand-binding sensory domain FIST
VAFAVAVSVHPVSSRATGEVVGQLFEAVGPDADLVVLLATPGHRGALEDIAAATRRLLSPGVLIAAVTTGLGAGGDYVDHGAGLAAWSGHCGPVAPVGPGRRAPPFVATGAFLLGQDTPRRSPGGPDVAAGGSDGAGVIGSDGVVGVDGTDVAGAIVGPVILDDAAPGPGPAGVAFGAGSGFSAAVVHGLRRLGPDLTVTRAEGTMIYELDGEPAWRRLIDLARDGMPAAELPTLGARLYLSVVTPGPADGRGPTGVLGVDRGNGALALRQPVEAGRTVHFAMSDPDTAAVALGRALGPRTDAALVLAPFGAAHLLGEGLPRPVATLICETAWPPAATPARSAPVTTIEAAFFSPPASRD